MRILNFSRFFLVFTLLGIAETSQAQDITPASVKQIMKKVADWQIDHYHDAYPFEEDHHPLAWTHGALYLGMVKWAAMTDTEKYYEWLREIGDEHEWQLHSCIYDADDHAVGQVYVELYRKYGEERMIGPTKERFNFILLHPARTPLQWESTPYHRDRWSWCDALFMSPPVWAKLFNVTGDKSYLDFMVAEFKATTDFLFDKKESLYYRDETYIGKRDNGTKIFWSRGNGWVFAGLANIMNELDPQSREYKYFLKIYRKMAKKLLETQTPEGHWSMSLLGQAFYPTPETSGTSFFVYGLAWGINRGILDKAIYTPAVTKGWKALVSHVNQEGMLGYVQPIGAAPGEAWPDRSDVYGTGAFLSAGSEVYKLKGGK